MSLRWRITTLVVVLLAAVLLGAGWSLASAEDRQYQLDLERRMRHLAFMGMRRVGSLRRPRGHLDPFDAGPPDVDLEDQADGAHAEALYFRRTQDGKHTFIGRARTGESRVPVEAAAVLLGSEEPDIVTSSPVGGEAFYVLPASVPGSRGRPPPGRGTDRRMGRRGFQNLRAVVYLEREPVRGVFDARMHRTALIGLLALVLGAGLAYLLAWRMLRPVRRAADAAEAIDSPDQRLPEPAQADELGRLVNVVNGMLGRIEAGAIRERTFLATASHELRRPLAALHGEIELALRGNRSGAELEKALRLSLGDAQAMSRLVDDLLLHARTRAGAAPLIEEEVDWVAVVMDAVERSRRVLPADVQVEVQGLPEVVLRGDAARLGQVVENLVTNAGTHGGPAPHVVVAGCVSEEGLELVVEDDGPGIAPEDLPSIFEPFGRGDRTRSIPGSGLGLAIVKDGVEAHGGRIEVTSPLTRGDGTSRGTRFRVHLPAARLL